jgi:cytochrome c nitrite reductase small subunit
LGCASARCADRRDKRGRLVGLAVVESGGMWRVVGSLSATSVLVAVLAGMMLGSGVFTFRYGEGGSYFSADPKACTNCHVMQPYYDSWVKSSHQAKAVCVDCHLPHDFVGKYLAKADNGLFHSWAFTFENFHEPIQIKQRNRRIVQDNCVDCHREMVHELLPATLTGEAVSCIDCHRAVGHAAGA